MLSLCLYSPVPTHPARAGNTQRVWTLAEALREDGWDVHFVHHEFQPGNREAMAAYWGDRYHPLPYHRPWKKHRLHGLGIPLPDRWAGPFIRRGWAYQTLDHFFDESARPFLAQLHRQQGFSVALAEYVFFSAGLLAFPSTVRRVLDTHDLFGDRHRLFARQGLVPEWYYTSINQEIRGWQRADAVLAIQEAEATTIRQRLPRGPAVFTVGHLAKPRPLPPPPGLGRVGLLASDGTLNREGLSRFLAECWPCVRQACPHASFHLYGPLSASFANHPDVIAHGPVADPADAYRPLDLVINPMPFGTGLKIKTIEILAHRRTLVSSISGLEGLPEASSACRSAPSPDTFAEAIIQLLQNPADSLHLAERGLAYASRYQASQHTSLGLALGISSVPRSSGLTAAHRW